MMEANKKRTGAAMTTSPRIRVGPSGWDYPGWDGVVYPHSAFRSQHRLEYLTRHFDTVEIESTFRNPLRPELAHLYLAKVSRNPDFMFTVTLGREFTHERSLDPTAAAKFKEGLWPLQQAGRLGCLLMQFPWAFRFTEENREFLIRLRRLFHRFPLAVELRHASWLADEAVGTMIDYHLGFVNIDQPARAGAMPATALVTSGVGYFRLHGQDHGYWRREFNGGEEGLDDYLYTTAELEAWAAKIGHVRPFTKDTYVILANPAAGKSVVNGLQISSLLSQSENPPQLAVA
jgi:uncharacterized protein YecE (DUF72 family)